MAIRSDLADIALAGQRFAPHYAQAVTMACGATASMMHDHPSEDSVAVSQLLPGETFELLDVTGAWAWGYSAHDHYVGYIRRPALITAERPSHIVSAIDAPIFSRSDIKSAAVGHLPAGSRLIAEEEGNFLKIAGGYVHHRHAVSVDAAQPDWIFIAESYRGQPYLWGGRGAGGIDCSGLVQVALGRCGIAAPRDTDLQRQALGDALPDNVALRRGDLVFFPGHVGIMVDDSQLLHANAHWMATVIEPLADVVARLLPDHAQPILARRRL